jgi:hypothetical protein
VRVVAYIVCKVVALNIAKYLHGVFIFRQVILIYILGDWVARGLVGR